MIYINITLEKDEKNGYWSHSEAWSDSGREQIPSDTLGELFSAVDKLKDQLNNPKCDELPVYHEIRASIIKN